MQAAVFDMDGTLIDSMPGLTRLAVENMTRFFGISPRMAEEEYRRTAGLPYQEQLLKIFPGKSVKEVVKLAASAYAKEKRQITLDAPVFPIMRAILQAVPGMGGKAALVSSTDRSLVEDVHVKHFQGMFDYLGGYAPCHGKHEQIMEFFRNFNLDRSSRVFYYGDTAEDQRIAFMYDMEFVKVEGCLTFR